MIFFRELPLPAAPLECEGRVDVISRALAAAAAASLSNGLSHGAVFARVLEAATGVDNRLLSSLAAAASL
jgi:hypothetical protein